MKNIYDRIQSKFGEILIRTYEERDIPYQAAYIFDSPKKFLESIGFDPSKLGSQSEWSAAVKKRREEAIRKGDFPTVMVAEYNGRAISMVFLDQRNKDGMPRLHFHIFEPDLRGKGLGGSIFMSGTKALGKIHNIQKFFIEPKASNQRMNALMKKLGFKSLRDYTLEAGPVTQEMLVSQYEIIL